MDQPTNTVMGNLYLGWAAPVQEAVVSSGLGGITLLICTTEPPGLGAGAH
jgi:hypothetical protein